MGKAMDRNQHEQAVLRLAFEAETPLTTASVAYFLGIPSRTANELLNQLLTEGALELDSDSAGNIYYRIPSMVEPSSVAKLKQTGRHHARPVAQSAARPHPVRDRSVAISAQPTPPKQLSVTPPAPEKKGPRWSAVARRCLLYTSPSPRDRQKSRMPSSA